VLELGLSIDFNHLNKSLEHFVGGDSPLVVDTGCGYLNHHSDVELLNVGDRVAHQFVLSRSEQRNGKVLLADTLGEAGSAQPDGGILAFARVSEEEIGEYLAKYYREHYWAG